MAKYYKQSLGNVTAAPDVPRGPLKGGKLAKSARVDSVFRGLDKIPALGRRVVLQQTISGSTSWIVPETDPDQLTQTHPLVGEKRVVARARHDLTPGHVLQAQCLHLPSGMAQYEEGDGSFNAAGTNGTIEIAITWTDRDGTTSSTTHEIALTPSQETWGAAPSEPWKAIKLSSPLTMTPEPLGAIATMRQWSRHSHCEIRVSHVGSPRVIDVNIYEVPFALAFEADDDSDLWVSTMHTQGVGAPAPDLDYPLQRASEDSPDGDPRMGTWQLMDTVNAQALRLGPALWQWSAWSENDGDITTTEVELTADTDWKRLSDGVEVASDNWASDEPGASMSAGAYARSQAENPDASMANTGSIPVRCCVYMETGGSGSVRFYSSADCYVEVEDPGGGGSTWAWVTAYGHLRTGKGPGDHVHVTALAQNTTIAYACVYKADQYAPAAT